MLGIKDKKLSSNIEEAAKKILDVKYEGVKVKSVKESEKI